MNVLPPLEKQTCPSTSVDLSARVAAGNLPAGTLLTVHTLPVGNDNRVNDPSAITTTGTYYFAFYDEINDCYSPASEVEVLIEECCRMVKPGISFSNE